MQISQNKPFILGSIEEIVSNELSETRILNIYLPEGYDEKDTVKYPVIYLLDGSADEDFIHVAGLLQFNSFPWVNRVPKSILVGIANTNRKRDFTFPSSLESDQKLCPGSGGSANFISFLEKELQPYIENKYHTNTSKTIIGESLGGLLATEILFSKPYLFTQYIIVSPSLWWNGGSMLNASTIALKNYNSNSIKIYIGVGKEGLAPGEIKRTMEQDANNLFKKIVEIKNTRIKIHYDYLPTENHATIGHSAIANAFRILYST